MVATKSVCVRPLNISSNACEHHNSESDGCGGRMTPDRFSVADTTAVVTGSSSGIGRAIVERFAAEGANVVVTSREAENVEPVARLIESEGGKAIAVACDVTDRAEVAALVETTVEAFGEIDVLVNNAGASFQAPPEAISENGWKTIVDINLHGTVNCAQLVGERMRQSDGGRIINVASVAGQHGSSRMSHYGAAKAGVINFTRSVGAAWAEDGVWVNCIAPGLVATEGVRSQMDLEVDSETIDRTTPDRTIGRPEEIADIAQFLASPASSYVVGETIPVKGTPRLA